MSPTSESVPSSNEVPELPGGQEEKTPVLVTSSPSGKEKASKSKSSEHKKSVVASNRIPIPRKPNKVGTLLTSIGDGTHVAKTIGSDSSIGSESKEKKMRAKHRRVLSAAEGSAAQEKLLNCMGGLDLSQLDVEGTFSEAMKTDLTESFDDHLKVDDDKMDTSVDSTKDSTPVTATALSQWNSAAQSKAGTITDLSPSPPPAFTLNNASATNPWDPDDDDDGLVIPIQAHTTENENDNSGLPHHHFPIPIRNDSSSVGATAAFSTSSQHSIMSQYSSDLEVREEDNEGLLGEEEDLMGELLPNIENARPRKGKEKNSPSASLSRKMEQIQHQRRMQNETNKIISRNLKREFSHPTANGIYSNQTIVQSVSESLKKTVQTEVQNMKGEIQSQNQLHFEKILNFLQSEAQKRNVIEHRLQSQLLLQSEAMVAMELKLLRLESKVERREKKRREQYRKGSGIGVAGRVSAPSATSGKIRRMASPAIEVETDGFPLETMILANVEEVKEDEYDTDSDNEDEHTEEGESESGTKESSHENKKVLKKIVAASSGASLVSAVTAMSGEGYGLEEEESQEAGGGNERSRSNMEAGEEEGADTLTLGTLGSNSIIERTNPGLWSRGRGRYRGIRAVVTGIATEDDSSQNTPTQSSNRHIPNLESILLNPLVLNNSAPNPPIPESAANTTRAIRSPHDLTNGGDDDSTLATSVTSATWTSTVVTGATSILNTNTSRGGSLITGAIGEHSSYTDHTHEDNDQSSKEVIHISLKEEEDTAPRETCNSPLTVPSISGYVSNASSDGTALATGSMATTAAVAPSRDFRTRRARAAFQSGSSNIYESSGRESVIPSHVKTGAAEAIEEEVTSTRSRSNSPLTLPSMSGINSVAPSLSGTSFTANSIATMGTTAAVAPSRDFRSRRAAAAAHLAASAVNERTSTTSVTSQPSNPIIGVGVGASYPRPLTNRVVTFVKDSEDDNSMNVSGSENMEGAQVVFAGGTMGGIQRGEMDSLTVPDELDNLSDIDTAFASTSARWREEYEARLEALQKRLS